MMKLRDPRGGRGPFETAARRWALLLPALAAVGACHEVASPDARPTLGIDDVCANRPNLDGRQVRLRGLIFNDFEERQLHRDAASYVRFREHPNDETACFVVELEGLARDVPSGTFGTIIGTFRYHPGHPFESNLLVSSVELVPTGRVDLVELRRRLRPPLTGEPPETGR